MLTAITTGDVEAYTNGRLSADDAETQNILDRAVSAVRTFCEWHVSPVIEEHVVTLDGPGGRVLALPTGNLVTLHSITEDGVTLDLNSLRVSAETKPVLVRKRYGQRWSCEYGSIVVTMTHGYADEAVEDWRLAVLDACDRFSQMVGNTNPSGLKKYDVDDIKREWFDPRTIGEASKVVINERLCEPYRLVYPL